jgi:hypothetical protein
MEGEQLRYLEREACALVAEALALVGADSREFRLSIGGMKGPRDMRYGLGLVWKFRFRGKLGKVRWLRELVGGLLA